MNRWKDIFTEETSLSAGLDNDLHSEAGWVYFEMTDGP
jgi:hypothetical protein